ARARSGVFDALIVDTAGRLHVDESLMAEVREIDAAVGAAERLFVVDAMAGQDAVNAARAFGAALDLTGVILTKADGDARGLAAPSHRQGLGRAGAGREPAAEAVPGDAASHEEHEGRAAAATRGGPEGRAAPRVPGLGRKLEKLAQESRVA